ncbi:MAG: hypothetical protein ACRDV9_00570, partial [Acidimicrobiia bacterium]
SYPHQLIDKCAVLVTVFDDQLWVSDPPVPVGPAGESSGWRNEMGAPGTFTMLSADLAGFRNFAGETALLRRSFEPPSKC